MVMVQDVYIVQAKRRWLMSTRPDLLGDPGWKGFSPYTNDAKQFKTVKEARKEARKVCGKIFKFNPVTQALQELADDLPPSASCGNCGQYTPMNGACRNPESENYRETVLCGMKCSAWEGMRCG